MQARYAADVPLIDGAPEAVQRLADVFPLGLASSANRPLIDLALARAGIAELFTVTVSSEEAGRGKPAPDVYIDAARRLNVEPKRCAAIEDSATGIKAAHAAEWSLRFRTARTHLLLQYSPSQTVCSSRSRTLPPRSSANWAGPRGHHPPPRYERNPAGRTDGERFAPSR
jgi:FMN phosphatase YigB (HAD superfamily)